MFICAFDFELAHLIFPFHDRLKFLGRKFTVLEISNGTVFSQKIYGLLILRTVYFMP